MVVKLRLQRIGLVNLPMYRIVAANAKAKRDGKYLERLGSYDPVPDREGQKHISLNLERAKYWLGVGAQPSETVAKLLSKTGLIPPPPIPSTPGKPPKAKKK